MKQLVYALAIITLFSCGGKLKTSEGEVIDLSVYKGWPDSLAIETYSGGGMDPAWTEVYISKDSCYFTDSRDQIANRYDFKLTVDELNTLFVQLMSYNIDRLGVKELDGVIYDKGR